MREKELAVAMQQLEDHKKALKRHEANLVEDVDTRASRLAALERELRAKQEQMQQMEHEVKDHQNQLKLKAQALDVEARELEK